MCGVAVVSVIGLPFDFCCDQLQLRMSELCVLCWVVLHCASHQFLISLVVADLQ